jgi:hypothetical protein
VKIKRPARRTTVLLLANGAARFHAPDRRSAKNIASPRKPVQNKMLIF